MKSYSVAKTLKTLLYCYNERHEDIIVPTKCINIQLSYHATAEKSLLKPHSVGVHSFYAFKHTQNTSKQAQE